MKGKVCLRPAIYLWLALWQCGAALKLESRQPIRPATVAPALAGSRDGRCRLCVPGVGELNPRGWLHPRGQGSSGKLWLRAADPRPGDDSPVNQVSDRSSSAEAGPSDPRRRSQEWQFIRRDPQHANPFIHAKTKPPP